MNYGLTMPPIGPFSDPKVLSDLAVDAENAGWDGFFIWDHNIYFSPHEPRVPMHPLVDPWIGLAAVAVKTSRIKLGPMVTSLARRRPWKVARETASLDLLSGGRLIMGIGLGSPADLDFGTFGEETDDKARARKMDEGLAILDGLWTGEPFSFNGEFYNVAEVTFLPRPVQSPRIPIWIGGGWNTAPAARRAARWDGFFPLKWLQLISVDEWHGIIDHVNASRSSDVPITFIQNGYTPGDDPARAAEIVAPFAEMGLHWWIENIDPWRFGLSWSELVSPEAAARMTERVRQGPPRVHTTA
ncbi:MAG: LLM class flavin-dependent oxidoreductase [Anaerolineaceae bacterium]|nr:LLM class flavin-dependent oxidoreductase [Anaerolineaceae bacterium]